MPYEIPKWIWDVVVILVLGSAIWRGGRDERIAGIALAVGVVLSKAVYSHEGQQTEWGLFFVDLVLLAVLTWIALISTRYWPIFAAAFQFLAVIIHLARLADPSLGGWAYISAEILFGYLLAGAIAVALHDHFLRSRWIEPQRRPSSGSGAYNLTVEGTRTLAALGLDLESARTRRRRFAYACLDWSERRPHVGGALGAALLNLVLSREWVARELDSRALAVTRLGRREFHTRFGLQL